MIDDVSNGSRRAKRSKEDLLLGYFVFFPSFFFFSYYSLLLFLPSFLESTSRSTEWSLYTVRPKPLAQVRTASLSAAAAAALEVERCTGLSVPVGFLVVGSRQPIPVALRKNKKTRNISQVCFFSKNTLVQYSSAREIYFSGPLAAVRLERNFERNIILQIICVGASYWAWWPCLFRHPPTKSSNPPNRLFWIPLCSPKTLTTTSSK